MKTVQSNRPLRVLQFICSTGFYGAEGWVLALCNSLDPEKVISQLAVTKESENHNLELTRKFRASGMLAHEIELNGRFDISAVSKLTAIIKVQNIDVIHTHGYKSDIIGLIAAKRLGIKCVCTPHGFENTSDPKMKMFIGIGCRTFKYFDYVAPLSVALCKDVARYGVKQEKMEYIPNGVDLKPIQKFLSDQRNNSNTDVDTKDVSSNSVFTLGYVGQLIDRKNIGDILNIFDRLCSRLDGLKLVIVGDGDKKEELEFQSSKLACADKIRFKGYSSEPLHELSSFDIFLMTSALEGIPRCLMESMAMRVPIVSYDIPGVDQLVVHDKTGMLAEYGDVESMVKHCEELIKNREKADRLSRNASEFVCQEFSSKAMAQKYTALFEKVCN